MASRTVGNDRSALEGRRFLELSVADIIDQKSILEVYDEVKNYCDKTENIRREVDIYFSESKINPASSVRFEINCIKKNVVAWIVSRKWAQYNTIVGANIVEADMEDQLMQSEIKSIANDVYARDTKRIFYRSGISI